MNGVVLNQKILANEIIKFIIWPVVLFGMAGCAAFVRTSSTTFHGTGHVDRGVLAVLPIDKTQEDSLEFKVVSGYLIRKLVEKGYSQAQQGEKSKYAAFITYGIDNGTTSVSSVPLYGKTGGGTSYSSGTVSAYGQTANYSGTITAMPTYGMVGVLPVSSTEYKRMVNVDIWLTEEKPMKVYEIRGMSSGTCGNINAIVFKIIDGMFANFPGENGRAKTVETNWDGEC